MPTPVYGFQTVTTDDPYSFSSVINGVVTSIENRLPHRFVSSISALNALSGLQYPSGQLAVLTASTNGLTAGATFVRSGTQWRFISGTVTNLTTFTATLSSNVGVTPGATFYDQGSATSRIFTTTSGNSEVLIGGSTWTNIPYPPGYKSPGWGYPPSYRLVPGGVMLRGCIGRTNNAAIPNGTTFLTIPAVARPTQASYFTAQGSGSAVGNLECRADGTLYLKAAVNRTSSWYSIDGFFLPQN